MTFLRKALDGIVHFLSSTGGTMSPTVGAVVIRDHCPHCDTDTAWHVSILQQFTRCSQCGRDPELSPSHYETDHAPVAPARDAERTDEPAAGSTGHRDATREGTAA